LGKKRGHRRGKGFLALHKPDVEGNTLLTEHCIQVLEREKGGKGRAIDDKGELRAEKEELVTFPDHMKRGNGSKKGAESWGKKRHEQEDLFVASKEKERKKMTTCQRKSVSSLTTYIEEKGPWFKRLRTRYRKVAPTNLQARAKKGGRSKLQPI